MKKEKIDLDKVKLTLSFWGRILTIVCLALVVLTLFCPVITAQLKANAGDTQLNGNLASFTTIDLLGGMSLNEENFGNATEQQIAAYTLFFSGDNQEARAYAVLLILSILFAAIGVVIGVLSILFKKLSKFLKYIVVITFLFVLASFILGFVTASAFSTSAGIGGILGAEYQVSVGWSTYVAFVGGLIAVATPFALTKKEYQK